MNPEQNITSLNVSLPEGLKSFVEAEVATGGYTSASEFVRELIREAQKRRAREERLLLQGLDSGPGIEATPEFWRKKREALAKRHGKRKG